MKLRRHIVFICIVSVLASASWGSLTFAQYLQPPFMAPTPPSLLYGVFYLNAGAKYRVPQSIKFTVQTHSLRVEDPGTVPFGPENAGYVFYPGSPDSTATDPNLTGLWVYDNGQIDPTTGTPWNSTLGSLGHIGTATDQGSFQVDDPLTQTSNAGGIYGDTSSVNFTKVVDGTYNGAAYGRTSRIVESLSEGQTVRNFKHDVWAPYIELGYQCTNYFDLIFGSSWFGLAQKFRTDRVAALSVSRRAFTDTFTFDSNDIALSWIANFESNNTGVNPLDSNSYVIFPSGVSGQLLPTRTFSEQILVANVPAVESIANKLDISVWEMKFGGRSWFPLYGIGQIGTSFGGLFTPIWYEIAMTSVVTPTLTVANADLTAGVPALTVAKGQKGTWYAMGAFGGIDLSLEFQRFFFRSTAEYDIYFGSSKWGGELVENEVNLSGMVGTLAGGIRF